MISSIIVVTLLSVWMLVGWVILDWAKLGDRVQRGLLAPALGMAVVVLIATNASFAGLPVRQSVIVVAAVVALCVVSVKRFAWSGFSRPAGLYLLIVLGNLASVGLGLLWFGESWQGLVNEDAATGSLAAQYFSEHGFFWRPGVESIASGLDYSALSSMLYVEGGHRFGDVLLLAVTANLFRLTPDQVYMAHALAIRCVLIAVAALLIYRPGDTLWRLGLALVCLTIAPLGAYLYLNQLIAQMGGLVLLMSSAILIGIVLQQKGVAARAIVPPAMLTAALCQYYPESITFLGLALFVFCVWQSNVKALPPLRSLIKPLAGMSALVIAFLNLSLPNTIAAAVSVIRMGTSRGALTEQINADFSYAFTPDFPATLLGFRTLREGLDDPWATLLQVIAAGVLLGLAVFAIRNRRRFATLFSFCATSVIVFSVLFLQKNGFGTFKVMLLMQPFLFVLLAAALSELAVAQRYLGLLAVLVLFPFLGRTTLGYTHLATRALGSVPHIAQHGLLDKIAAASTRAPEGLVVDTASILSGKFAVLRDKANPLLFEHNFAESFANEPLRQLVRQGGPFEKWLPDHERFWTDLRAFYKANYKAETFDCLPQPTLPTFSLLHNAHRATRLLPGGMLVPLNRVSAAHEDYVALPEGHPASYLAFRPSSVGDFYGIPGVAVAIYDLEADPLVQGASMAAVGRYILFEVLSASDKEVRLGVRYTRTFLGGTETKLPEILIVGATTAKLWSAGSGALSIVSEPVTPCLIAGRKFLLLDFGVETTQFKKVAPRGHQWLGVTYAPDRRKTVGFLRDVSITSIDSVRRQSPIGSASEPWDYEKFESVFEFSGMFEDGWVSDQLLLRLRPEYGFRKVALTLEVPGGPTAQTESTVSIEVDGALLHTRKVSPGSVTIEIDVPDNPHALIKLSIDPPFTLPGNDGRPVAGLLRTFALM